MGKFVKVILYIILLSFAFIWFSTVFKSCGKNTPDQVIATTTERIGETAEDAIGENTEDLFEEDFESDNQTDSDDSEEEIDYSSTEQDSDDESDYVADDNTKADDSYEEPKTSYASPQSNSSSSYGNYMVVAGSYLVRSNAESMVRKLSNMGYDNSEIVVFQSSQYNSVIAGRFDDYGSAVDVVNQLKRKDIQAYAHRRK